MVGSDLNDRPEPKQLVAIKSNPWNIKFIKNPSEAVQLAAVKQSGSAIRFIKNPTDESKLIAIQQNIQSIQYIKDMPSNILRKYKRKIIKSILRGIRDGVIENPKDSLIINVEKWVGPN